MTEIIIVVLILLYVGYLFFEKYYHKNLRKKFKMVIHVNGTRGKSTICRLLDAGLREAGYKVFTKTTGTKPTIINVNNEVIEIKRLGNANILEQYKILRKAVKDKAEILVVECMAVTPKLQLLTSKMLDSDITIISNVYHDHLDVMGESLEEIAEALSLTIPENGDLIIADDKFLNIFKEKAYTSNTNIHYKVDYEGKELYKTFKENIELSLKVAEIMKIDKEIFLKGFYNYHSDIGAFSIYEFKNTIYFNGFSINDPDSIKRVYNETKKIYNDALFSILINFRDDRQSRTLQHIELLKELEFENLYIMGTNTYYVKNKLKKAGVNAKIYREKEEISDKYLFLMGNYKGTSKIVNVFEQGVKIL